MTKKQTSINDLLNLLVSKNIPFKLNYFKGGRIELVIYTAYFKEHGPTVYLSTCETCHKLINTIMDVIEKECSDGDQK